MPSLAREEDDDVEPEDDCELESEMKAQKCETPNGDDTKPLQPQRSNRSPRETRRSSYMNSSVARVERYLPPFIRALEQVRGGNEDHPPSVVAIEPRLLVASSNFPPGGQRPTSIPTKLAPSARERHPPRAPISIVSTLFALQDATNNAFLALLAFRVR